MGVKRVAAAGAVRRVLHQPARVHAPRLAREQRVDRILAAARELFCAKGYEACSVAEIAARIGVVEGTIYKYFDSKRELLLRVLEHWYEEIFGQASREIAGLHGPRERLHRLVWCQLRSIRDYPLLCRLMFREVRSEQDYHGSQLHERNRRHTELLMSVIQQGVNLGEFRADMPTRLLRDMVYGGIEHATWNYVCGRGELDIDRLAEQIGGLVCDGLIVPSRSARKVKALGPHAGRKTGGKT